MIAWNEESIIQKAIESTKGLADEIIVVDTGSTDSTVDLCKSLRAKVFVGADRMNKGESRNKAIEESSGDWVIILDADETIADPVGLRLFIEDTNAQALYIRLAFVDGNNNPTLSYQQMRCWKRDTYRYKYRAHEIPVPTNGWGKVTHTSFIWEHRPPRGRKWKTSYTLERLLLDVAENPGNARPIYYLGRQYMYAQMWKLAVERLNQYIEMTPSGRDTTDAWNCLSSCHGKLGHKRKQIECLYLACSLQPRRRDLWGKLAEIYHADGKDELAIGHLKCALEVQPESMMYTFHQWHGSYIHDLLARCLWKKRRYDEGHTHALSAIRLDPDNMRLGANLVFFEDVVKSNIREKGDITLENTDKLKVIVLAGRDHANVGYRISQALNLLPDCVSRSVSQSTDYIRYPKDIFRPTQSNIDRLCEWADVIHIVDSWDRTKILRYGKPIFVSYNGKYYRDNHQFLAEDDEKKGITQLCTTIDLTKYGAKWIPVPMGITENVIDDSEFRIVQAPTRKDVKGTEYVELLSPLYNVDIIQGVSNVDCLSRIAKGNIAIDQFGLGYGVFALESWSLGLPILANAEDWIIELFKEHIENIPFYRSDKQHLQEMVEKFKSNVKIREQWRKKGQRYLSDFHDPLRVARELVALYIGNVSRMDTFYNQYGPDIHSGRPRHKAIAELVEGKRILDLGCGTGDLLLELKDRGYTLFGTDISSVALKMAKQRGISAKLRLTANVPKGKYDTVVISQVIEHLENDSNFLSEAMNVLRSNGVLIVSVPYKNEVPSDDHKHIYTRELLHNLLNPLGNVHIFDSWPGDEYRLLATVRNK